MIARLSPHAALYGNERPLPPLPPCVHYAGNEKFPRKALELQFARGPAFDIAGDCEDGAPIGGEAAHRADDRRRSPHRTIVSTASAPAFTTSVTRHG
jgi:hypothetical protein